MSPRTAARTLAITAVTGLGLTALATPALASDTTTVTLEAVETNLVFSTDRWIGGTFTPADSGQPPQVVGTSVTFVFEAGISLGESSAYLVTTEAGALFTADGSTDCAVLPLGCSVVPSQSTTFLIGVGANNDRVVVGTRGEKVGYVVGNVGMDPSMAFTVTYSASPTPDPGSIPGPYIQQFGVPTVGTCDEAAPESLNWGGAESGGWGESWAQWANDGDGGDVCTRTLGYNSSTGMWEVQ